MNAPRFLCTITLAALSLPLSAQARKPRTTPVTQAEVDRITREAILIDTHNDIPSKTVDGYDIATPEQARARPTSPA